MALTATFTGFSDWIKANEGVLIEDIMAASDLFNPAYGFSIFNDVINKDEKILNITSSLVLNEGNTGKAFRAALTDDTKMSGITMNAITVEDEQFSLIYEFSVEEFDQYLMGAKRKLGDVSTDKLYLSIFAQVITNDLIELVDELGCQGDKSKSGNIGKIDGLIKKIKAASPLKTGTAAIAFTSPTAAMNKMEAMIKKYNDAHPKLIKKVKRILVSNGDFEYITSAYYNSGKVINKDTLMKNPDATEFTIPGKKVILTAMSGFDGTYERVLGRPAQFCGITDSLTGLSSVKITQDTTITDFSYIKAKFKLGTAIALGGEFVIDAA